MGTRFDGIRVSSTDSTDSPEQTNGNNDGNTGTVPSTDPSVGDGDPSRMVQFSSSNFNNAGYNRLDMNDDNKFEWSWRDDSRIKPLSIYLMLVPEEKNDSLQVVKNDTINSLKNVPRPQSDGDQLNGDKSFFSQVTDNSANLHLDLFMEDLQNAVDEIFSIMISWEEGRDNGYSYSPYFTVIDGETDSLSKEEENELEKVLEDLGDVTEDGYETTTSKPIDFPTWNGQPMRTASAKTGSETEAPIETDSSSGGGGGGGGGLAPGVIAGIVVGCIAFLSLIGVLAWFLLRRRRNAKPRAAGYADPAQNVTSNAYIVDKIDTSGQSPQSPYSDDGQEQITPLDPNTNRQYSLDAAQQPSQPYQDSTHGPSQPYDPSHDEPRGASPQQRSESAARNYAHLVEEGMTQDDIRRLEEEERQLDDEIEARAGRRR